MCGKTYSQLLRMVTVDVLMILNMLWMSQCEFTDFS